MKKFLIGLIITGAAVAIGAVIAKMLKSNSAAEVNDTDDFDDSDDFYDFDDLDDFDDFDDGVCVTCDDELTDDTVSVEITEPEDVTDSEETKDETAESSEEE